MAEAYGVRGMRGRIATSLAGRDKGTRYAIIDTAGHDTVLLSDGKLHKADKPKKKKLKHLQLEAGKIENMENILLLPGGTADAALRRALKSSAAHHEDEIL